MNQDRPLNDLDATFTATSPEDTFKVMKALRAAGITFDVSVNTPKDDPNDKDLDIFWFNKEDDQELIGRIVKEALAK